LETFRRLINKSKALTGNSNFTLQVSSIDGLPLIPKIEDECLLIDGYFNTSGYYASRNSDIDQILSKLEFDKQGIANTFFEFDLGLGLPKNYIPHGILIKGIGIFLNHNLDFAGPRTQIWSSVLPVVEKNVKTGLGHFVPTDMYKLLSELLERKIHLEFPAVIRKSTAEIYGAVPTSGNLKGYLREKRII